MVLTSLKKTTQSMSALSLTAVPFPTEPPWIVLKRQGIFINHTAYSKKKNNNNKQKKNTQRADAKKIQLSVRANPAPWALNCTMPEGAEEMYKLISFLYFVRDLTRHYIMTPEVSSDLYLARICCRPRGLVRHNFVMASSEKMHFWGHSISKCCGRNSGYWESPLRVCRLSLSLNNL